MGAARDGQPETVAVVCPTCSARLHPVVKGIAYLVTCPDCFVAIRVPSRKEAAAQTAKQTELEQKAERDQQFGTYQLSTDGQQAKQAPSTVSIICPQCRARRVARVKQKAWAARCPKCQTPIKVPSQAAVDKRFQEQVQPVRRRRRKQVRVAPPVFDDVDEVRRIEYFAETPRWTFFSGVWVFPWRKDTWSRWFLMSLGFCSITFFIAIAAMIANVFGGGILVVFAFFFLPILFASLLTFSYASASGLAIIIDTAAGADIVEAWPEANWREWVGSLGHVAFVSLEAVTVGVLSERLAIILGFDSIPLAGPIFCMTFPIILLSSLEDNSMWTPLTMNVIRTLWSLWWGWILFYVFTFLTWAAVGVATWYVEAYSPLIAAFVNGPLTAAAVMISARLMGRLWWRASLEPDEETIDVNPIETPHPV